MVLAHFAKNTRFDDVGSISTALQRPHRAFANTVPGAEGVSAHSVPGTTIGGSFKSFHLDQEEAIKRIAHREISEPLNLSPHIKIPKTDAPPKYCGEDNLDLFMKFVELHFTWLRSQALCGYDLSIDRYRTTMLKGHLDGAALEWFIQMVNSSDYAPQVTLTFTETLCALHRRFVTSANAQRATKAFDAVRYDNDKGPDAFAEQLLKRANLMHHVPDEFAVNRRFLAGLPQTIRFKLRVDRQMSAEYTPFLVLRCDARQLWIALGEDAAANPACATPSAPCTAAISSPNTARRVAPSVEQVAARAPVNIAQIKSPGDDTHTCFKCGIVGHIGSNLKCPKYSEPVSGPRFHQSW
ncbi:hypothetical protein B0H19DRAFT_1072454 [Mycena capillaripes]|nr:hypothetical protein B0H19DRAFT_1072454 [Mycena capillaripes]